MDPRNPLTRLSVPSGMGLAVALLLVVLVGAACAAPPASTPDPILGVTWRAVGVAGHAPQADHPITLQLEPNGRLGGSTGCNSYGADFRLRDGRLLIGEVVSTAAMCADPVANDLERRYMEVLRSQPRIGVEDGQFRLRSDAAEVVFAPAS